jgi:hypothetical protein
VEEEEGKLCWGKFPTSNPESVTVLIIHKLNTQFSKNEAMSAIDHAYKKMMQLKKLTRDFNSV